MTMGIAEINLQGVQRSTRSGKRGGYLVLGG